MVQQIICVISDSHQPGPHQHLLRTSPTRVLLAWVRVELLVRLLPTAVEHRRMSAGRVRRGESGPQ